MKKEPEQDAWKQYNDLIEKYTTRTDVRTDLVVYALAYDRGVEVRVGELNPNWPGGSDPYRFNWSSTGRRNVDTMRELAQAILDACDFVDESNPEWARIPTGEA